MLEFRLLGPLEVRTAEGSVPLAGAKQRALLTLLLLEANRMVPRERLIDGLWGADPPESAAKGIQLYVSQLRKLVPEGTILTRPPGYLLAAEPESVDLGRFQRLLAQARAVEPDRADRLLREALALWRGPPLAEFTDEPFFRAEAGRLEELRLAALEQRIDVDLALGRHGELVGELESLIAQEPHRERLHGQRILALYRSGRQAEATAAYRTAREALDELGLEPTAALRELHQRVLSQDERLDLRATGPAVEAARWPLPGLLVPMPAFAFVGRGGEREALRALLARAEGGEGGLVLLGGEAGGGKTRLVRELAHDAADTGVLVVYGTADATVTTPYQPLREWLEFLLRASNPTVLTECLGAGGRVLARLVPELSRLTGPPDLGSRDAESERFALQAAVTDLLDRLSRRQPLLVVADDVHWADAETLHLLLRLARFAPEARVLVLAAFRDRSEEIGGQFADRLVELDRLDGTTRVALRSLDDAEVEEFITGTSGANASPELVTAIGELTDGTPLLLCELWRELHQSGAVEVVETMRLTRPVAELRGSERLGEVVHQRVARLTPQTAALLELAAVTGTRFELRVVADAAGLLPGALVAAVEEAVDAGMIEELPDSTPACRFSHELVRRAVYDRIKRLRRAELHLRIGEALERTHAADPGRVLPELAHHLTLAAPVAGPERAVAYNLRAADAALDSAALLDAAAHLSRALEVGIADPHARVRVQIDLGWLLGESGQSAEARRLLEQALETATGLGDRGPAATASVLLAWRDWLGLRSGNLEERRRVAESGIETFTGLSDRRGLALARHLLSYTLRGEGRGAEAVSELEQALVDVDASRHAPTRSRVISQLMQMLCLGPTPAEDAIRRCEELRRACSGEAVHAAMIERPLVLLYAMVGRADDARECDRHASLVLDQVDWHAPVYLRSYSGDGRRLLGDFDAAEQHFLAVWRRFGGEDGTVRPQTMGAARDLCRLCLIEGRWDEARHWASWGDVGGFDRGDRALTFQITIAVTALLALHEGDADEASALAHQAVQALEDSDFLNWKAWAWSALAEVQRARGQNDEADAAIAAALDLYERKGNLIAASALRGSLVDGGRSAHKRSAPRSVRRTDASPTTTPRGEGR